MKIQRDELEQGCRREEQKAYRIGTISGLAHKSRAWGWWTDRMQWCYPYVLEVPPFRMLQAAPCS